MTRSEYREMLITGIIEMQKNEGWTIETLRNKTVRVLEKIYDTVGLPAEEINWKMAWK